MESAISIAVHDGREINMAFGKAQMIKGESHGKREVTTIDGADGVRRIISLQPVQVGGTTHIIVGTGRWGNTLAANFLTHIALNEAEADRLAHRILKMIGH
jgi:hypothetical protein